MSKTNHVMALLMDQQQRNEARRQVQKQADALIYALGIPNGRELVLWLTNRPAKNNHEAVTLWVTEWIRLNGQSSATAELGELLTALKIRLMAITDTDQ